MKLIDIIKKMNKVALIWIAAWIVVYLFDLAIGLQEVFCSEGISLIGTEYYRLFTGLLLHINLFHLIGNIGGMYFICQFLDGKINNYLLFACSVIMGTGANLLFSLIRPESYMVGGSPMIFVLIGFIIILQWRRKDLPRFQLKTRCGNWIVGYATLGNLPFFSKDGSTFLIHMLGLAIGLVFGFLIAGIINILNLKSER